MQNALGIPPVCVSIEITPYSMVSAFSKLIFSLIAVRVHQDPVRTEMVLGGPAYCCLTKEPGIVHPHNKGKRCGSSINAPWVAEMEEAEPHCPAKLLQEVLGVS